MFDLIILKSSSYKHAWFFGFRFIVLFEERRLFFKNSLNSKQRFFSNENRICRTGSGNEAFLYMVIGQRHHTSQNDPGHASPTDLQVIMWLFYGPNDS